MLNARAKYSKEGDAKAEPNEFERTVCQAIFDLETNTEDLKAELKDLHISAAEEVELGGGRKAILITIPYRLLKAYQKIHARLVRELEKKFSGKTVIIVASRRILPVPPRKGHVSHQLRPRSRTLTMVHEAILDDIIYPAEIVGKRTRYRLDGSKTIKVYLPLKEKTNLLEFKLDAYRTVYKKLTGKDVIFDFPVQ